MGVADQAAFHHTCFVVNDVDKTAEALAKSLSITWALWTIKPEKAVVRGQDVPYSFRVAIGQVGDGFYELIAPLSGDTIYVDHLRDNGEGFHHTAVVYPSVEAVRAARDELVKQGREILQVGGVGDTEWYYFDIPGIGILEVLHLGELGDPEKVIS
jgi:methylmalonyl-CoA/ethylmalonyl-CoA epimerase